MNRVFVGAALALTFAVAACSTSDKPPPANDPGVPPPASTMEPPPAGAGDLPPAKGPVVAQANMPAFCKGEAAKLFAVNASLVQIPGGIFESNGGYAVDGTYEQGGPKTFTCRFDGKGSFIDVIPTGTGGVL